MEKIYGLLGICLSCFLYSCDKGATNTPMPVLNLPDTAETLATLDSTSLGIYKAVLAGEGGRIKIYINNGNNVVKAYLAVDSLSDSLTCVQNFIAGDAINGAIFTGRISSFRLNADAMGNNATINNIVVNNNTNLPGVIAHERSTVPVFCYGTKFTGTQTGHFNFLHAGNYAAAVGVAPAVFSYHGNGLVTGDIFYFNLRNSRTDSAIFQGGIDGTRDYFSGSWNNSLGGSGVFSGQRIL